MGLSRIPFATRTTKKTGMLIPTKTPDKTKPSLLSIQKNAEMHFKILRLLKKDLKIRPKNPPRINNSFEESKARWLRRKVSVL